MEKGNKVYASQEKVMEVAQLAKEGKNLGEICLATGVKESVVKAWIAKLRKAGAPLPKLGGIDWNSLAEKLK